MNKPLFDLYAKWSIETFDYFPPLAKVNHLLEEVNELKHDIENELSPEEIESEFADCVLLLFDSMRAYGFNYENIEKLVMKKMLINFQRKWGKPDENGVTRHVEESKIKEELKKVSDVDPDTVWRYKTVKQTIYFELDGETNGFLKARRFCNSKFLINGTFPYYSFAKHFCNKATLDEVRLYAEIKESSIYLKSDNATNN